MNLPYSYKLLLNKYLVFFLVFIILVFIENNLSWESKAHLIQIMKDEIIYNFFKYTLFINNC